MAGQNSTFADNSRRPDAADGGARRRRQEGARVDIIQQRRSRRELRRGGHRWSLQRPAAQPQQADLVPEHPDRAPGVDGRRLVGHGEGNHQEPDEDSVLES